jgi:hypothetical protein
VLLIIPAYTINAFWTALQAACCVDNAS